MPEVAYFDEPELQFGNARHIDVRFGLMNHGALDVAENERPDKLVVGLLGSSQSTSSLRNWLGRIAKGVEAKESPQPQMYPPFPGIGGESRLSSSIEVDDGASQEFTLPEIEKLAKLGSHAELVEKSVDLFADAISDRKAKRSPRAFLCALPAELEDALEGTFDDAAGKQSRPVHEFSRSMPDFHDLLKAKAMALGVPIQVVRPETHDSTRIRKRKRKPHKARTIQHEAIRAWNFYVALYYKCGGTPWKMVVDPKALSSLFVGIGFYKSRDQQRVQTSVAQVFNERGVGVVLRGAEVVLSKDDRQPHLSSENANELLLKALKHYRSEHKTAPARVVVHKTSSFNTSEIEGFRQALDRQCVEVFDFVSFGETPVRLYRDGQYPPLRGTCLHLSKRDHVLYTKGSVPFFRTYPGMYIPNPLLLRLESCSSSRDAVLAETLALTKMNWNNTQFDGREPITLAAARKVGAILKYVDADGRIESRYSYYM